MLIGILIAFLIAVVVISLLAAPFVMIFTKPGECPNCARKFKQVGKTPKCPHCKAKLFKHANGQYMIRQ